MPSAGQIRAIVSYAGKVAVATTVGLLQPGDVDTPFARQRIAEVVNTLAKRPQCFTTLSPQRAQTTALFMRFDLP